MTINSNNRCSSCHGTVRNAPGKRKTIEQLTIIHDATCPGQHRVRRTTKKETS